MKLNEVQREFLQHIHSIDFLQMVSMKTVRGKPKFLHVKSVMYNGHSLMEEWERWDLQDVKDWLNTVLITKNYTIISKQWLNSIRYQYINLHGNKFKRLP